MWIYEKFQAWSDNKGDPAEAISVDHMLDDITLYWVTDTAASSARLYYESFAKDFARMPLDLPVGVSIFQFHTAEGLGRSDLFEALQLERGCERRSLRRVRATRVVR